MTTNAGFSPGACLAAIARGFSRADGEMLKVIAVFCGLILVVGLLFATDGFDTGIGFF